MMNNLPEGWGWTSLSDCCEILDNERIPINAKERQDRISNKKENELYPYYGATGQVGWIDDFLFDDELVLLGEDGAPFLNALKNKAYLIKGKSWVNNHAHVLKAVSSLTSNKYICNYLNYFDYNGYVTGTTRYKLNQSRMKEIPVLIPPLPEQHRIVTKIEELFTKLSAGMEALKQGQAQLKRYRQTVLKAAIEGRLTAEWREQHKNELEPADKLLDRIQEERKLSLRTRFKEPKFVVKTYLPELPNPWVWANLEDLTLTKPTKGSTPTTYGYNWEENGILFLRSECVTQSGITEKGSKFISNRANEKMARSQVLPGDILMRITGEVGICCIFPNKYKMANINQHISVIRLLSNLPVNKIFLTFQINSPVHKYRYNKITRGTTHPHLSLEQVRETPIIIPPLKEQERIVDKLEKILSVIKESEVLIESELKRAQNLRLSILKHAFEGKLVPQNPNDEPASILLERIIAEKSRSKKSQQLEMF